MKHIITIIALSCATPAIAQVPVFTNENLAQWTGTGTRQEIQVS